MTLEEVEDGTLLTLVHSQVPDGQTSYQEGGWEKHDFEPMIAYFAERKQAGAPRKAKAAAPKKKAKAKVATKSESQARRQPREIEARQVQSEDGSRRQEENQARRRSKGTAQAREESQAQGGKRQIKEMMRVGAWAELASPHRLFFIIFRMKATAAGPFRAPRQRSFAIFSCSASASGADVIIATPTRMFGSSPRRNGLSASTWRSGWRKILKARVRQRVRHDADLDADRFVLHQCGKCRPRRAPARAARPGAFGTSRRPARPWLRKRSISAAAMRLTTARGWRAR